MDPSVVRVVNTGISNGADFDKISLAMYNAGAGDAVVEQAREYYNSIKKKSPSVAGVSPSTSAPSASSSAFGPTKVQSRLDVDPSGLYGQVEDYNKRVNTANRLYDVLSKKEELSEQDIQNVRNDYQEYRSFYPDLPVVPSQDNSSLIDKVERDATRTVIDAQPEKSKYRDFMESIYENQLGGGNGLLATILRGTEKIAGDVMSFGGAINDATDAFYSSVFGEETTKNYNKAFEGTPLEPGAISQFSKGMAEQWNENTKKIAENWDMTEAQYEQGPSKALMEGDLATAGKGIAIGMLHTMPELVATALGLRLAKGSVIAGEALTANLISKGTPKWIAGAAGRARAMAPTSIPLYTGANYAEVLDDPEFTTGEKMLYAVGSAVGSTLAESVGGFGEYFIGGAAKKEAVNQIKSSVMQSIGKGTVDALKAAGIEGAEEVLDGGIQQALGVALGDRKFSTNNILDGFLIGAAMGGSTNVISKSPSLIGLSSDMLKTIKITDELAKINAALTDPSISDSERELLTNRVRAANDEIRRAKQTASVFFQNYTPEDLQETISLNADIRRQVMDLPSFKTEEAKSAAIQSVRDSVSRLKEIEGKYDSKTQQQVQGDIQAGAQPGGVQIEGTGTEEAATDRVLQDVSQSEEEQVARQRTEQASSINVKPRLKRMKVTTANAPGAYRMMMDALSNYTDEFLSQNGTSRAAVERGIKSLFDVVSSLDAKGREVEIDVIGSIDEANKLFGFEVKEDNGKFVVSSKIPDAGRVFDTMEEANAYTNRVLYRGVNMMTDGDKVNISVLLPAMLDNTGYHEALHSLEVFDDKAADKLVVNLMRSLSKLPRLDARMIAFMDSYRGKPEADRNREFLAELGSMISSGEISVEVRDSVIKNMTDTFMKFIRNMLGIGGDVTPSAGQLARTFNDIADKLGRGEKQASYATTGSTPKFQRVYADVVNGFYSNTENALSQIKQEKATGNWWSGQLLSRGAKSEEMNWTTLTDFLEANKDKSITKSDIAQYLKDNRIQIVEVVKGVDDFRDESKWKKRASGDGVWETTASDGIKLTIDASEGEGVFYVYADGSEIISDYYSSGDDVFSLGVQAIESSMDYSESPTKFSQYQLEGDKENYKEVLVTLPQETEKANYEVVKKGDLYYPTDKVRNIPTAPYPTFEQAKAEADRLNKGAVERQSKGTFKSTHFNEPNILVHLRMNTRYSRKENENYLNPKTYKPKFDEGFELIDNGDNYQVKKIGSQSPYFNTYSKKIMSDNNMTVSDLKDYLMSYDMLGKMHPDFKENEKLVPIKVLFLEEVQSDWGQKGKKEGFKQNAEIRINKNADEYNQVEVYDTKTGKTISSWQTRLLAEQEKSALNDTRKTPTAPFVTDTNAWVKLGLKVALKEAVAQGADRLAWTTGEQQNERYDLSKQVDEIRAKKNENGTYKINASKDGSNVFTENEVEPNRLPDILGKELAEKIVLDKNNEGKFVQYKEQDLKVGGKGMRSFYGVPSEGNEGIIGKVAKSVVKELTGKSGEIVETKIDGGVGGDKPSTQSSIEITPELKAEVKRGAPKFQTVATFFSGAGTLEAAMTGAESLVAVEYAPDYIKAYNEAFNTDYKPMDVLDINPQEIIDANPDIFHASPTCKSFSRARAGVRDAKETDIKSAESVARVIRDARPRVVTIENVPGYKDSAPYNKIMDAIKESGYKYDEGIYNAADFGGIQDRKRLIIRASLNVDLPAIPKKQAPKDWFKALEPMIDSAPDSGFKGRGEDENWEVNRLLSMIKDGKLSDDKPIITMGGSASSGLAFAANAGGPAPTLTSSSKQVPRIIMPDGRIKRVTPEMMRVLMGLPKSYKVPSDWKIAKEVLGNGIDGNITRAIIEPLSKKSEDFRKSQPKFQTPIDEAFDRQRALLETMSKRGGVLTKAVVKFADRASPLKKALIDANLKNARDLFVAQAGAGSRAKMFVDENFGAIYDDLNKENSDYLDKIIQLRRIIQIDEDFDSKGKERIQHTEGEGGVPINKEIAEANLNDYRNTLGITLFNDLMRRSETYFDAYKKLLDIMRENGLITQDLYDTLKPLLYQPRRFLDNFVNFKDGDTSIDIKDLALNAAQIKKLEGGSDSEIMMNSRLLLAFSAKSVFSRVARNKTYTAIAEAANDPNNSSWISTDSQRNFSPVNYFVDGEKTQFYIREDFQKQLYDATRHLIDPNIAKNIRILSGSAILKSFATQVNPLFALKNFPRDVLHVAMFTNIYGNNLYSSIFKISRDAFKGMHDKMSKSTDFKEWLEYGGGMDFLSTEGFEAQSIQGGSFNKLKDVLSTFGEYSEVGVRLAVYKKTKGDLMSDFVSRNGRQPNAEEADQIKTQAAVASREIIDFAQGGSWAKAGENVIPYLNASIQGFRVGAQYIKNNPVNFAIKLAQLSLSVGIIMFYNALVADDDDWEKISDGEKMRNFIIFTPLKDKKGNRYYLKIAKTQQAMPFTTLAEIGAGKMLNQVLNQDDDKGIGSKYMMYGDKEYTAMKDAVLSFLPKNPAEWTKEIKSAIPILNAVNAIDNYDTFFNTKVSYDYEKVESRYEDILDPNTPYFYKALSQSLYPVVGIGPKRLATAVEKVTTGPETSVIIAGAYFMLDKVASKVANVKTDDLNIGEVPTQNSELKAISSMFSPLKSVLKATNPNLKKYQYEDQLNEIALKSSARVETIKSASRNLGEKYYDAVNGKGGLTKAEVIAEFNDFRDMLIKKNVPQSQVINFVNSFKMSARSNPRENWDAGYYDIMYSPTSDATVEMIGKLKGKNLTDEQLKDYMIKYRMNTGYNIKNAGEVYKLYRQQRDAK